MELQTRLSPSTSTPGGRYVRIRYPPGVVAATPALGLGSRHRLLSRRMGLWIGTCPFNQRQAGIDRAPRLFFNLLFYQL